MAKINDSLTSYGSFGAGYAGAEMPAASPRERGYGSDGGSSADYMGVFAAAAGITYGAVRAMYDSARGSVFGPRPGGFGSKLGDGYGAGSAPQGGYGSKGNKGPGEGQCNFADCPHHGRAGGIGGGLESALRGQYADKPAKTSYSAERQGKRYGGNTQHSNY